ncbi:MAG: TonB-dependent receptor [Saprospiraceae bacterium]|nr:TonB-dependent receptor [Saprospiraceae bacterium]
MIFLKMFGNKMVWLAFAIFVCSGQILQAQQVLRGIVKDAKSGDALIGASIQEKGTSNGTITDYEGNYELKLSTSAPTLIFSYVGYVDQEIESGGRTNIDVMMSESSVLLDQIVVVGYGVQKKSDVTGSISSLKGSELERITTPNVDQALQGKIAGVYVTPASGAPGTGAVVRIRGTGSFNGSDPLYVIDGMLSYDASFINPQDVESIEVLKDASAAAIYGSRGANGVIIITTKNGKNQKDAQISVSSYYGTQQAVKQIDMLNGAEFARAYNQFRGMNFYPNPDIFGTGTNWQDEIFRDAAIGSVQLSATGGNDKMSYNFSTNYFKQDGILKNTAFTRGTFRLNTEYKVNSWANIGTNVSYATSNNHNGPNVVLGAYRIPSVLAPTQEDGSFTDPTFFGLALSNPAGDQFYKSNNYSWDDRLFGNVFLEAKFLKNFTFKTNFGFDRANGKGRRYEPKFQVSASQLNLADRVNIEFNEGRNWVWEQTLNYYKEFKDHTINVMAGFAADERRNEFIGGSRENFPGTADELLYLSAGNDTTQMNFNGASDRATVSQLFRLNYGYKGKYLFTANWRIDKSSIFQKNNQAASFPSFGLGWNAGREDFISGLNIFDRLKIRAGYGVLGNQNFPNPYPTSTVINSGLYAVFGTAENINQGAIQTNLTNTDLVWEATRQLDIGFEAGFLNNRLELEVDWYRRQTFDIIAAVPIPGYVGSAGNPIVNTAEVLNKGFDITLNWRQAGTFAYNLSANLSPVQNEVLNIGLGKSEIFDAFLNGEAATRSIEGLPLGAFYGYRVAGIFQSTEEIQASPRFGNEAPGDIRFADLNGDGILNSDDREYLGSPIPTLTYGFSAGAEWKGIDFAIDFLGVSGNKVFNAKETSRFAVYNWEKHVADAWTTENPSSTEPRVTNGGHNYRVSDRFLEDGSFLRLRSVNLGYTIPNTITNTLKIQSLRIYVSGTNLWTRQQFSGYSPEFANSGSPFRVGFDDGQYPIAKSWQFGIDFKF